MKRILYGAIFFCSLLLGLTDFFPANVVHAETRSDYLTDPAVYYTTMELLCADGYPAQEHKVVTDDGYILTLHRIPNGKRRSKIARSKNHYLKLHKDYHPDFEVCVRESLRENATGYPVMLVHGLLMASDGWLLQGPGYDLAYLLADAGYDVWMPNVRGNFYSKEHMTLTPSDAKFWDFSFHENGYYDMPASIDYILKQTKRDKLFYIGLSMGTTIFFAMASSRPEYQEKIIGFIGLAPVVYSAQKNMSKRRKKPFEVLMKLVSAIEERGDVYELFPRTSRTINIGRVLCSKGSRLQDFCYDLTSPLIGYHTKLFLRSRLHLYYSHTPTGTSLKTLVHYSQNIKNSQFKWFDLGLEQNLAVYGAPTPPDYPVWRIKTPIALYYCEGDFFYDIKDEKYLEKLLPNVVDVNVLKNFNHGDYLWAYKARDLVYARALFLMKQLQDKLTAS